jgi:hypothetical protein
VFALTCAECTIPGGCHRSGWYVPDQARLFQMGGRGACTTQRTTDTILFFLADQRFLLNPIPPFAGKSTELQRPFKPRASFVSGVSWQATLCFLVLIPNVNFFFQNLQIWPRYRYFCKKKKPVKPVKLQSKRILRQFWQLRPTSLRAKPPSSPLRTWRASHAPRQAANRKHTTVRLQTGKAVEGFRLWNAPSVAQFRSNNGSWAPLVIYKALRQWC